MGFSCVRICDNCGKDVIVRHKKRLKHSHIFCNRKCESEYRINHNPNYIPCVVCGKLHYVKPYMRKEIVYGSCCSYECLGIYRQKIYQGENNPNYNNRGSKNPLWKGDTKMSSYGYILRKLPNHPFANGDGHIFEHRYVAEQYLLTPENSVIVDGKAYLSPEYDVHHIDKCRTNNDVSNLMVLTRSEHMKLHQKLRAQERLSSELASQNPEKTVKPKS